ncbi:uncharacterized protein LOC132182885 [Corylus avellana]|uniref:uncharacterized protein LOC132182885 n=1 Tax=Corylus avellana TaxID=13451 RepID=UPI001E215664|nr:uncharacterized protein LOC132182885 [Corylus avellana]XP_059452234.1 uncharacterized protein LOC132182885 [Corylus avellana]
MDVKGVTWVGNIYQKFEAMCLEVEEIMYQDTVNYVENQVQNVGESVKKFYSDVMQDLLPPSSFDPVKVPASDLPVERYSDVGIYKKPKLGIKRRSVRVGTEKLTEDSKAMADMHKAVGRSQSLHEIHDEDNLFPPSSEDSVKRTCSEFNSNMGIKENAENDNLPLAEMSGAAVPINDVDRVSSFCELLNENGGASCDHTVTKSASASVEVRRFDSLAESCKRVENASEHGSEVSMDSASSDMTILITPIENEGIEMRLPYSDGVSAESNAADICTNDGVVSRMGMRSLDSDVLCDEIADKEGFVSHPERSDDWSLDAIESSTFSEQGVETKVKLEETCVLVDGEELHFFPHKECKRRPYKKKIREAFSSRMRSARKQEYEQLAVWYGNDGKSNQGSGESSIPSLTAADRKKSATSDICETEWELL